MVQAVQSGIFHGVGRRKSSVARVWLRPSKGKEGKLSIDINGKSYEKYFDTDVTRKTVATPFGVTNLGAKYSVEVNVEGGGLVGQADAVKLGIARALLETDETLRSTLKKFQLLSVDSRVKERKKYGQKGARRKFQFVKR